jgi:hypothetical protein
MGFRRVIIPSVFDKCAAEGCDVHAFAFCSEAWLRGGVAAPPGVDPQTVDINDIISDEDYQKLAKYEVVMLLFETQHTAAMERFAMSRPTVASKDEDGNEFFPVTLTPFALPGIEDGPEGPIDAPGAEGQVAGRMSNVFKSYKPPVFK